MVMDNSKAIFMFFAIQSFSHTIIPFTQKHLRVWLIAETVFNIHKGSRVMKVFDGFKGTENDITFALIQAAEQGPVWTVTA